MDKQSMDKQRSRLSIKILKHVAASLFSSLFPSRCILCHQTINNAAINRHVELCEQCFSAQPENLNCCNRCALPLVSELEDQPLCGRCIRQLPDYDYVNSLFRYEGDVINLVHQLKFSEKISYARSIGELLMTVLNTDDLPECYLPVPLHSSRLRQRGYNQSIEITRVLSKNTGIPIEYDAVIRHRSTQSQTGLNAKQRQKNIRGAFELVKKLNAKHVLIVDDVMTTGATVNELARCLKEQEVERVGVLCIARAPMKG